MEPQHNLRSDRERRQPRRKVGEELLVGEFWKVLRGRFRQFGNIIQGVAAMAA